MLSFWTGDMEASGGNGKVVSVSLSESKGERKTPVERALLIANHGLDGDAHAGDWHRQVSLLALESIAKMRATGIDVNPGDFAENITTEGVDVPALNVGDIVEIGDATLEITQIGKECHTKCAIFQQAGDCVMPREGVFARVLRGGEMRVGMDVRVNAKSKR